MVKWIKKHWEVLSYLVFGVLCTLLNIVLYALFNKLFGYTAANSWGNVLDNILCILFAYATNRAFVFRSKTTGKAMAKEFGTFVTCRLGTMVLDAPIMTTTLPHDDNEDIEYCTDPELIDEKFGDIVDLVIDGGIGGTEGSTVVDCTNGEPEIIRQGLGWLDEG